MKKIDSIFGPIEVDRDLILNFKEGLPGFPQEKEFVVILNEDRENPLHWLQSVGTRDLAFIIVNPFEIYDDYDFKLPKSSIKALEIENEEDLVVYTIVSIPEDISKMTTNLAGPLVINRKNRLGKQVIVDGGKYTTKHYIFKQEEKGAI